MVPFADPAAFVFGSGISGESVSPLVDFLVTKRNDALLELLRVSNSDVVVWQYIVFTSTSVSKLGE